MAYVSWTRADVEAMVGSVAVEVETALRHVQQVVAFVTGLGANPITTLTSAPLSFSAAQAQAMVDAFSGTGGLTQLVNAFNGAAAIANGTNIKARVDAIIGTALF